MGGWFSCVGRGVGWVGVWGRRTDEATGMKKRRKTGGRRRGERGGLFSFFFFYCFFILILSKDVWKIDSYSLLKIWRF